MYLCVWCHTVQIPLIYTMNYFMNRINDSFWSVSIEKIRSKPVLQLRLLKEVWAILEKENLYSNRSFTAITHQRSFTTFLSLSQRRVIPLSPKQKRVVRHHEKSLLIQWTSTDKALRCLSQNYILLLYPLYLSALENTKYFTYPQKLVITQRVFFQETKKIS